MNLCDVNVWLALVIGVHRHGAAARNWLHTVTEAASIIFCRSTQQSFLRLLTNAEVLGAYGLPALTNRRAWQTYEALLGDDRISLRRDEPPGLEERWKEFAARETSSPKIWMDAYLAAFAMAGGYRMITIDRAYRQFRGLDLLLL